MQFFLRRGNVCDRRSVNLCYLLIVNGVSFSDRTKRTNIEYEKVSNLDRFGSVGAVHSIKCYGIHICKINGSVAFGQIQNRERNGRRQGNQFFHVGFFALHTHTAESNYVIIDCFHYNIGRGIVSIISVYVITLVRMNADINTNGIANRKLGLSVIRKATGGNVLTIVKHSGCQYLTHTSVRECVVHIFCVFNINNILVGGEIHHFFFEYVKRSLADIFILAVEIISIGKDHAIGSSLFVSALGCNTPFVFSDLNKFEFRNSGTVCVAEYNGILGHQFTTDANNIKCEIGRLILQSIGSRHILRVSGNLLIFCIDRDVLDNRIGAVKRSFQRLVGIPTEEYSIILSRIGNTNCASQNQRDRFDAIASVCFERNGHGFTQRNAVALYEFDKV